MGHLIESCELFRFVRRLISDSQCSKNELFPQAYIYCSVAFLQFMKEANIVVVFFMGCAVGLQVATRTRILAIAWIVAGTTMAVHGEHIYRIREI